MSHGPAPVGGGVLVVHRWLLWPWHVQRMTAVPLAVPAPFTSRHSPDCTPVIDPSEFCRHCWFAPPVQDQMITAVPGAVWLPVASTHRVPLSARSSPAEVNSKAWLAWPEQSRISSAVPGVSAPPVTFRHRPEAALVRDVDAADAGAAPASAAASIAASTSTARTGLLGRPLPIRPQSRPNGFVATVAYRSGVGLLLAGLATRVVTNPPSSAADLPASALLALTSRGSRRRAQHQLGV